MIDIRGVAQQIASLSIQDANARQAAVHEHLRNYGVELLMNLHNAIVPTTPAEAAVVEWLRGEIAKIIPQIPSPIPKKESKK